MKKIPTIFERDWTGDRSRVLDRPHPDCGWVFAGEGVATCKLDGTSCMVRGNRLFKRYELRPGKIEPAGFERADHDPETDKIVGWVPVGDGPEDKWHREALASQSPLLDGTYELLGPKIQGNPEGAVRHCLADHRLAMVYDDAPRAFGPLRDWLAERNIEGIVWHHPDGRMAKIKKRDFGLSREPAKDAA